MRGAHDIGNLGFTLNDTIHQYVWNRSIDLQWFLVIWDILHESFSEDMKHYQKLSTYIGWFSN